MIQAIIGDTTSRKTVLVPNNVSVKQLLEDNGVAYANAQIQLDGVALGVADLNNTLADLGVQDKCILVAALKLNNA